MTTYEANGDTYDLETGIVTRSTGETEPIPADLLHVLPGQLGLEASASVKAASAVQGEACWVQMRDLTDQLRAWSTETATWLATNGAHGAVDIPLYRTLRTAVITAGFAFRDLTDKPQRIRDQFEWMSGQAQVATSFYTDFGTQMALEAQGLAP